MKKDEFIKKYGEEAYAGVVSRVRVYDRNNRKRKNASNKKWCLKNPEKAAENHREWRNRNPGKVQEYGRALSNKGGKHYKQHTQYKQTGIQGEREKVRKAHGYKWRPFKRIIAQESQIHHEWVPGTSNYNGVALVEVEPHMHGFINVIQILKGEITMLTEEAIKNAR